MKIDDFLRRLKRVKKQGGKWSAECPGHDDRKNSLGVDTGTDGRILVTCYATCYVEHVVKTMGLEMSDLFPENVKKAKTPPVINRTYDYRDENDALLYQVVRMWPKDFRQRRPDKTCEDGWAWDTKNVRRVPYRLPEILKADKSLVIHVVEGEKDADRLMELGLLATTNAGGAGKWLDDYSQFFEGRLVAVLPDNDEPGLEHAQQVKKSLIKYHAQQVEIVRLPKLPAKGDVTDFFDNTEGLSQEEKKEQFNKFVEEAFRVEMIERDAMQETNDIAAAEAAGIESWNPKDLVMNVSIREPEGYLYGELLARQTVAIIHGPQSSGKSYFVMYLGAQIARGEPVHGLETRQGRVMFMSEEMGGPDLKFRSALVWDNNMREKLSPNLFHFRWFTGFDFGGKTLHENDSVKLFVKVCTSDDKRIGNKPNIVFIDSLSKIHNADENSNQQMGIVMKNLELAARLANVSIVIIHHMGKASEFRTGAARARGASCIVGTAGDVIACECVSTANKTSVVSFEKTRSLGGRPVPVPFIFSQEIDPNGRTVTKSDGKTVPAVVFTIGNYEAQLKPVERDARTVRDTLKNLCSIPDDPRHTEDGEVYRADMITSLQDALRWSSAKAERAIIAAVNMGFVERGKIGKETVLYLPKN